MTAPVAPKVAITKLDAARRQLWVAISLWFQDGDEVAIHTLACAAHQIIHDINQHRGGNGVKNRFEFPSRHDNLRSCNHSFSPASIFCNQFGSTTFAGRSANSPSSANIDSRNIALSTKVFGITAPLALASNNSAAIALWRIWRLRCSRYVLLSSGSSFGKWDHSVHEALKLTRVEQAGNLDQFFLAWLDDEECSFDRLPLWSPRCRRR